MNYFYIILIICILTFSQTTNGQTILPLIENFSKQEYQGDNQIWAITQGEDHTMYFANNQYFVRYNGAKWEKYQLPSKSIIRSVFAYDSVIYTGSFNEFGYWRRDHGSMKYTSLSEGRKFFQGNSNNEEVWKIFESDEKIYFQTFNDLIEKNGNEIIKYKFPSQISYCYTVDNEIYAATISEGIYKFQNKKFIKVDRWNDLKNKVIHHITKTDSTWYFFTRNNGVFVYKNNKLLPWNNPLNQIFKKEIINTALVLNENLIGVGTSANGLYLINLSENKSTNINRNSSLLNNTILSIFMDREKDIWLGLDNGISHIIYNSPYWTYSDFDGILGSVYSIFPDEDKLLIGSNHGLFVYDFKTITKVEGSEGHVWDIFNIGDRFLIGHNDGTFLYKNGRFEKILPITGGWKIKKNIFEKGFIQAHYTGINLIEIEDNAIKAIRLQFEPMPIKDFIQLSSNELIITHSYKGVFYVKHKNDGSIVEFKNLSEQDNINSFAKILTYKGEHLFLINKKWYKYDKIRQLLTEDIFLNQNFPKIEDIINIDNNRFLTLENGLLFHNELSNNHLTKSLIPKRYYEGKLINNEISTRQIDKHLYITLDNGFLVIKNIFDDFKLDNIILEGYHNDKLLKQNKSLPNNSTTTFNVISGYYGLLKPSLGYSINGEPIQTINSNSFIISNLRGGKHQIKIFQFAGGKFREIKKYTLRVKFPWYFSPIMITTYLVLIAVSVLIYLKWNRIRFTQQLKIKEEELKFQNQLLQLELINQNEIKLKEYEKSLLRDQVKDKSNELASKSLYLAKYGDLIENIQMILDSKMNINELQSKIQKIIKSARITQNEFKAFEDNLLQGHEDFVNILISNYKNLTSKDIKLCIYLKMNL
ncbi:MAG: hypothetical protein JXL97_14315, partial [Bacteroidales bacterium]|nr:hypothetical protein [Bacteroidales bacterium]